MLYLLGLALMLFMHLSGPIGIPLLFAMSAFIWWFQEGVSDWEMRAAYVTLGFIPVQYAFFVGTTGHLSRIQVYWSLVLALACIASAIVNRHPGAEK